MSNANATLDPPRVSFDFRWEGDNLVCCRCGLRWRVGSSHKVNAQNFDYLVQHAELHRSVARARRRPPQRWH